jgi:hypothetical protein
MSTKVWDVTPPTDDWDRGYARLEWLRIDIKRVGAKIIEVTDDSIYICTHCGTSNRFWDVLCSRCDYIAQMEEDNG